MPKSPEFIVPHRLQLDSPYLSDYFGIWSIYEPTFRTLVEKCNGVNLHAHLQSADVKQAVASRDNRSFQLTDDGIALVQIRGPMMKAVPSMDEGTSTLRVRQQLRDARRDPAVKGAMLLLDTPGGTISGNRDLADDVAAFAAAKPIYAFTEDMTASAGVSIASQANKRFANQPTALYGAMGTYGVVLDLSGRADQLGIKVHVVRAGEFKGMGVEGTPITDQQLAEMQRTINAMNEGYLETIARGLGKTVESIRPLADGRVHTAKDAVAMGLLDGVQSFDATYGQLVAATAKTASGVTVPSSLHPSTTTRPPTTPTSRSKTMDPATLAELKATFPNSSAEWRESQLEAGADLSKAAIAFAGFVETQAKVKNDALQKQVEELTAKANANKVGKSGASPLGQQPLKSRTADTRTLADADELELESGDAIEDFNGAVAKIVGNAPTIQKRQAAIRIVARRNPELYKNYLLSMNPSKRQQRLIEEKLEVAAK